MIWYFRSQIQNIIFKYADKVRLEFTQCLFLYCSFSDGLSSNWTFRKTKQTNKKQLRKIQANHQQKNLPQNSQSKALSSNAECRKYLPVVFPLNIGHKSHFTVISRAILLCAARNQEGLHHCAAFLQPSLSSIGNHYYETCQSEWRKVHETSTPHKEL